MGIDWLEEAKQAYHAGDRQAASAAALIAIADVLLNPTPDDDSLRITHT